MTKSIRKIKFLDNYTDNPYDRFDQVLYRFREAIQKNTNIIKCEFFLDPCSPYLDFNILVFNSQRSNYLGFLSILAKL